MYSYTYLMDKGSHKKSSSLNGRVIERGGGRVMGRAIKEKKISNLFFQRSKISTVIKLEGGGEGRGLGITGPAIKRRTLFLRLP